MTTTKHDAALARPSRHTANSKMGRQIAAASSPLNIGKPLTAVLNTNDKAMWVLGFNDGQEATIKRLAAGVSVEPVECKAWLIEVNQGIAPAPIWLAHYLGDDYFTTDANTAIHFPTERSAKDVLDALFDYKRKNTALGFTYKAYAVTEHLFLDTLDQLTTAIAAARVQENERCLALMDAIGCDWRDAGDMAKFYATNYLREAIRALLGKESKTSL